MSISLPIGSGVHRGIERMRETLAAGVAPDLELCVEMAVAHFEERLTVDEEIDAEIILDLGGFEHEDQGKDEVARISRFGLPILQTLDIARHVVAAEVGLVSDLSKLRPSTSLYVDPDLVDAAWPFPTVAYADGLYGNVSHPTMLSDVKTSSKRAAPDAHAGLQVAWYLRPYHVADIDMPVMIDQLVKTVRPQHCAYAATVSAGQHEEIYKTVLQVAAGISAGDFPARPGWWCSWDHGWPTFRIAPLGFDKESS